jgi:hypothetical protein
MDLNAYLLEGVVDATTSPNEIEAAARSRRDAIVAMLRAFDPADAMEAMIACHCVTLQFLLNAAMRDAANINLEPATLARARAGAMSISRTLHQWVTKFETVKTRNEARATEAREAAKAQASAVAKSPEQATVDAPVMPPDRLVIHAPLPNGRAADSATLADNVVAAISRDSPLRAPGDRRMTL